MSSPKVFISHASEDKQRFVMDFARRLRANGVDAWVDEWEMLPGASFVDKIFEEGLKDAQAIIIVLSKESVDKPWVKEEMEAGFISRIEKGTKLIPVILEECRIPEALKSTLWVKIPNFNEYDHEFERILASIFEILPRPNLGNPPSHTQIALNDVDKLEPTDNLVLKVSCEYLLENADYPIMPYDLFGEHNLDAPPKQEVLDSIKILEDLGHISVSYSVGGGPEHWGCHYQVTLFGFEEYCRAYVVDYDEILNSCAGLIVNEEHATNFQLQESLGIPLMIVNHAIRVFEENGYFKASGTDNERIMIWDVSPKLKRILRC